MEDKRLPDFLIIPSVIVLDKNLQPLDGLVYGLVYWYTKLRLQKCIASNQEIGSLLNSNAKSVSNSLSRLSKWRYVHVMLNPKTNQREEIIPLVTFSTKEEMELVHPPSNDGSPSIKSEPVEVKETKAIKPRKKYSSIRDLRDEDFQEIADKYHVSVGFVKLKFEVLQNYCESKGRKYKNYKSALRNFVLGDLQRNVERRSNDKYQGVDARNV